MAAQVHTWTLSEILAEWRLITGVRGTGALSDNDAYKRLNDYYCNRFPLEVYVDLLHSWYTQSTAVSDNGNYSLGQTVLDLEEPVTVDNYEMIKYHNPDRFFQDYPDDENYITAPTLAIGVSDTKAVKNSAFVYDIQGDSYSASAAETSFSGLSTVPQNKYGGFCLKIDSDGTITIYEASDNETGYDSPGQAVDELPAADSDTAYMGFLTVMSTGAGGFVPGTTALDNASVTDTYTDGKPSNRGDPEAVLIYDETLYVRPRADRIMQIKAPSIIRPDALDSTDAPLDIAWGSVIALGSAVEYLRKVDKNTKMADELQMELFREITLLSSKRRKQNKMRYSRPSF